MIKIAYNYQVFVNKYGGASRIFSEIAPIISKSDNFEVTVYAGFYQNEYLHDNHTNLSIKGKFVAYPPKTSRIFPPLNSVFAQAALAIDRPDVVHNTYYSKFNTVPKNSKIVVTVLDMIHEKFSYLMRNADLTISAKAEAIKRADWIICISESTKQDLIEILNVNPEKISVIYLSYSTINQTSFQSTPVVTEPYILYTGLRGSYKNFDRLLKAYASNSQLRKTHKIVCFGDKSFSQQEIDTMVNLELDPHQVLHYFGSDSLLANFYTHADALVYPSLYEGFGIPPLEAMSFNCPVICSNTSSIPEVVGDAGEYFDPYDIDSISDALEKVIFSTSRSEELVSRGQKRVKLFSWHKCAKETMEVYNSLA